MEYNIELTDKDTTPIGRVEFYETCYDEEEGHFFFYGKFGRLKKWNGKTSSITEAATKSTLESSTASSGSLVRTIVEKILLLKKM